MKKQNNDNENGEAMMTYEGSDRLSPIGMNNTTFEPTPSINNPKLPINFSQTQAVKALRLIEEEKKWVTMIAENNKNNEGNVSDNLSKKVTCFRKPFCMILSNCRWYG